MKSSHVVLQGVRAAGLSATHGSIVTGDLDLKMSTMEKQLDEKALKL